MREMDIYRGILQSLTWTGFDGWNLHVLCIIFSRSLSVSILPLLLCQDLTPSNHTWLLIGALVRKEPLGREETAWEVREAVDGGP